MKDKTEITSCQADTLLERYYEGLTSKEEEDLLRDFLTSCNVDERHYKADKAVWGFIETGRMYDKRSRKFRQYRMYGVAASLLLVLGWGIGSLLLPDSECVAYVNGKQCSDDATVVVYMRQTFWEASQNDVSFLVEEQFKQVFCPSEWNQKEYSKK